MTWDRRQSRSLAPYEALEWPVTETALALPITTAEQPGPLISEKRDTPSFLSLYTAAAAFFWLDRQPIGGSLHQGVMYRHQDLRVRIAAVRVASDYVEVEVEGDNLDGLTVELAGDAPGPSRIIWKQTGQTVQIVRFPLTDGLPSGSWVVVRRAGEWLDRRFLSVPYSRGVEAGVMIVVDATTKLEALVSGRERERVEFKRQVPKDDDSRRKVMKTVCAFANGDGGSVLFGVDDDRQLMGLDEQSIDGLRDQLTQMVGSWVEPRPDVQYEVLPIAQSEKVVLELLVKPGTSLHGCGRPGETRTPYIRHQGVTERGDSHRDRGHRHGTQPEYAIPCVPALRLSM